ncbi:MAG TPA: DUF4167 domain-containing protein [Caulobacteraceae bacterium]|jgi:hypothetical protein
MKRSRSRNRSGSSGGGNKPQQNANRAFDSNGPENVKVRGHAQTVFEKYQQLARDAASAGDRVLAENHLQHAEHYFRVLRAVQPNRPVTEIMGRDAFTSGLDIDFEDESLNQPAPEAPEPEAADGGEARAEQRQEQPRGDYNRDNRQDYNRDGRQDYNRDGRKDYNRDRNDRDGGRYEGRGDQQNRDQQNRDQQNRDQQPRGDRPDYRRDEPRDQQKGDRPDYRRDDRNRDGGRYEGRRDYNRDDRNRDDRPREDRPRDDRRDRYEPRGERNGERAPETGRDPLQVVRPESTPLTSAPAPEDASPRLRGQDGAVSEMPAFLQAAAAPAAEDAPAPAKRPRTRRKPSAAEAPATEEA